MSDQPFAIEFDRDTIEELCRKWRIKELSLFGSVLTDEFRPDSDVDVLITFEEPKPDLGPWGGAWETMREDLQAVFGRKIDLVEKKLVRNPFRRHHILTTRRVIYAA
jgi:Predicted nucleotidyltransferases